MTHDPRPSTTNGGHTPMPERTQLNVRVDADTLSRLQLIAIIENETVSDLVRKGVRDLIAACAASPEFQEKRRQYLESIQGDWDAHDGE